MKNIITFLLIIIIICISGYLMFFKESGVSTCSGFSISYRVDPKFPTVVKIPAFPLTIDIKNSEGEVLNTFKIDNVYKSSAGVKIYTCNIFVIKTDLEKNFSIWRYSYLGKGQKLLELGNYAYQFQIDPLERYITLERSYLGQADYALVIKNLATTEDIFEVSLAEIVALHPQLESSLGMYGWSADGRYFWGNIFDSAKVLALLRVDMETKTWDVFTAPVGMLGGDAFNVNTAWTTYDNGLPWTGDPYLDEINRDERLARGEALQFYLYNVITKERRLLETIEDVSWSFKPEWVGDTELRYQVPGNLDKRYTLPTR